MRNLYGPGQSLDISRRDKRRLALTRLGQATDRKSHNLASKGDGFRSDKTIRLLPKAGHHYTVRTTHPILWIRLKASEVDTSAQAKPRRKSLQLVLHVACTDNVQRTRRLRARHRLKQQMNALAAYELADIQQIRLRHPCSAVIAGIEPYRRRFDGDVVRRNSVGDQPGLHEFRYDDYLAEARHCPYPTALRKDAAKGSTIIPACRRTEYAWPYSAGTRTIAPEWSIGVAARTYRLVVVDVIYRLFRGELLKPLHIGALVHNYLVPIALIEPVRDYDLMSCRPQLVCMTLGEDLYPSAHIGSFKKHEYLHALSLLMATRASAQDSIRRMFRARPNAAFHGRS